jgi:hypothetical protein
MIVAAVVAGALVAEPQREGAGGDVVEGEQRRLAGGHVGAGERRPRETAPVLGAEHGGAVVQGDGTDMVVEAVEVAHAHAHAVAGARAQAGARHVRLIVLQHQRHVGLRVGARAGGERAARAHRVDERAVVGADAAGGGDELRVAGGGQRPQVLPQQPLGRGRGQPLDRLSALGVGRLGAGEPERLRGGRAALGRRGLEREERAGVRPRAGLEDRARQAGRRHPHLRHLLGEARGLGRALGAVAAARRGEAARLERARRQLGRQQRQQRAVDGAEPGVAVGEQRRGLQLTAGHATHLADAVADRVGLRGVLEVEQPGVADRVIGEAHLADVDRAAGRHRLHLGRRVPVEQRDPRVRATGQFASLEDGERLVARGRGGGRVRRRREPLERGVEVVLGRVGRAERGQRLRRVVSGREGLGQDAAAGAGDAVGAAGSADELGGRAGPVRGRHGKAGGVGQAGLGRAGRDEEGEGEKGDEAAPGGEHAHDACHAPARGPPGHEQVARKAGARTRTSGGRRSFQLPGRVDVAAAGRPRRSAARLDQTAHSPSPRCTTKGTFFVQSMNWFIDSRLNSTGMARSRTASSNAVSPTRAA